MKIFSIYLTGKGWKTEMVLFYDIFIYPLELFMDFILQKMLNLTNSPLLSLTILSLVITVVSLPIYHIAETWQDKERAIQKKLKPKILEFKSVFKGVSLNTYINTLYRQNNYHPIHAVRTSFGLLIQIPFFFAAYHLLSDYSEFEGLKTFIFNDLGKPDGLLSAGNFSINIMPFVMTIVNIASSFIYSKKTIGKEKFQLYGIAALFLVVLYNSSAALLYYWTFNNIFSLIKNFVYTRLYKDGFITTSNEKKSTPGTNPVILRLYGLRPKPWTVFLMIIISAVAFFIGYFEAEKKTTELPALILSFVPIFVVSFFFLISNIKNRTGKGKIILVALYTLLILTAFTLFFIRVTSISQKNVFLEDAVYFSAVIIGLELIFLIFKILNNSIVKFLPEENSEIKSLFSKASAVIIVAIFIAAPMTVLSSGSASDFDESLFYYLSYLVVFSIIVFVLLKIFYNTLPERWRTFFAVIALFISILSLINIFIFTGDYGDMSHFIFKDEIVNSNFLVTMSACTIFFIFMICVFLIIKKKSRFITPVLVIALFSLAALSIIDAYSFSQKRSEKTAEKDKNRKTFFTFSKTGKNVVVLMLDRFIGGYVPQALKFIPELKTDLDGFIWYPNTLAPASYTIGGVPAIMGGWDYYIKNVNSTRTDVPLMDKLDESARIMPYNFDKAGYEVDIYADVGRWFKFKNKTNIGKSEFHELDLKKIKNQWLDNNKVQSRNNDNTVRKQLLVFGLFRAAPVFLREWIYDNGAWHIETKDLPSNTNSKQYISFNQKSQWRRHTCLKYYAVMDFLPEFSEAVNNPKNHFLYLSNNLPHEPHTINMNFEYEPNGKVSYPKNIHNKFGKSTNSLKHLYTDTATLRLVRDWIKWMKENDVYDNTRIILVSDHGRDVYNPFFDRQKIANTRKKAHPAYFNNLLMVKDFNSHGKIKTSEEFMTSLDVPYLAMKSIVDGTNPYTGNKIEIPEKKLPFIVYDTQWRNEKQGKYKYKYHEKYEVDKDISKMKNWKILKEK